MNLLTSLIAAAISGLILASASAGASDLRTALPATSDRLADRSRTAGAAAASAGHQQRTGHDNRYDNRHDNRYDNRNDSRYDNRDRATQDRRNVENGRGDSRDERSYRSRGHHGAAGRHESRESRHDAAHRYAATAVRQARQVRHLGYYPDHPRWSLDYRSHLHWALKRGSYEMDRENHKRLRKIDELKRHIVYGRERSYEYSYPFEYE